MFKLVFCGYGIISVLSKRTQGHDTKSKTESISGQLAECTKMAIGKSKERCTGRDYKQISESLFAVRNREWAAIKCLSHARC